VARAVEAGINFFDTAAVYGRGRSEEYLGRAIKELGLRDWVYIATKIHGEWLRRIDILTSVENAGAVRWMLSDDDWRKLDRLGWGISQRITYVTW
jgi:diketogulonate reductase-like aldo/keto reductase